MTSSHTAVTTRRWSMTQVPSRPSGPERDVVDDVDDVAASGALMIVMMFSVVRGGRATPVVDVPRR